MRSRRTRVDLTVVHPFSSNTISLRLVQSGSGRSPFRGWFFDNVIDSLGILFVNIPKIFHSKSTTSLHGSPNNIQVCRSRSTNISGRCFFWKYSTTTRRTGLEREWPGSSVAVRSPLKITSLNGALCPPEADVKGVPHGARHLSRDGLLQRCLA